MKRIIFLILGFLFIATTVFAYSNVIYLLGNHKIVVTTDKPSTIVFYQTNIGGNLIDGGKRYSCKDVTSCTLSVQGFWVYTVTGTTVSSYKVY